MVKDGITWDYFSLFGDHMGITLRLLGITRDQLGSLENTWDLFVLLGITWGYFQLLGITEDYFVLLADNLEIAL